MVEYLGGVLPPDQSTRLEEHLDGCERCQSALGAAVSRATPSNPGAGARADPRSDPRSTRPRALSLGSLEAEPLTAELPERYLMVEEHGRGGQAIVWRVLDTHIGREIVLKELRPDKRAEPGSEGTALTSSAQRRFLREARITAQLEHPGIAPVHELGRREDGRAYYTQKLVRGRTLAEELRRRKSLQERLALLPHFVDVCQAVAYAHQHGVVHRDLKPANVMVGEFGETVLLDWGLAKLRGQDDAALIKPGSTPESAAAVAGAATVEPASADAAATADGTVIGTPAYMSPEQAAGQIDQIDERSDVFSLGVVLYEILAGRLPFLGRTTAEMLFKVLHSAPPPVRELCPEAPPELVAVAERALRKAPAARYPSAKSLAAEVAAWGAGTRVGAYEYSSWELLARILRKNRALAATGALLLLVVAAAAVVGQANYRAARRKLAETLVANGRAAEREQQWSRAAVFHAAARVQSDRADAQWGLAFTAPRGAVPRFTRRLSDAAWVSYSPDGKLLAVASGSSVLLLDAATGETRGNVDTGGKVHAAAFAPDGARIASTGVDQKIRLWDVATLSEVARLEGHGNTICCLAFSPKGDRLASASMDRTVRLWDLATRRELARVEVPLYPDGVVFAPDGKRLAVLGADKIVHLWDPASKAAPLRLEGHEADVMGGAFSPDGKLLATGGFDKTARLWDVVLGKQLGHFEMGVPSIGFITISFSPDGRLLATPGPDSSVLVWDVARRERLLRIDGHSADLKAVVFGPDGSLATSAQGGVLRVWDVLPAIAALGRLRAHEENCRGLAFSPDGQLLGSVGWDDTVRLWGAADRVPRGRLEVKPTALSLAFAPDSRTLATGALDGAITLRELPGLAQRARLEGGKAPVRTLRFSPDGALLAAIHLEEKVRLWDVAARRLRAEWSADATSLDFAPGGKLLAVAVGRQIQLFDVASGKLARVIPAPGGTQALAFSPDGARLAHGNDAVELLELNTDKILWSSPGSSGIQSIAFSPDGKLLAAAGATLDLIDATSGQLLSRRKGPEGYRTDVAFSPDGGSLVASGVDGSIWSYPLRDVGKLGDPERDLARGLAKFKLELVGAELVDAR